MWPFGRKQNLLGFSKDDKGNLTFSLTDEEENEVQKQFNLFKDYWVHPKVADQLQKGLVARGLSNYARDQIMMSGLDSYKNNKKELIEKAIAAISKAYSFYQLPIYLYDLACFMEIVGNVGVAKDTFKKFLDAQSDFKLNQIDEPFLEERNIDEAVKDATSKVE